MTHGALGTTRGIAAAVELTLARPAKLGSTRLVAIDGPSGSGKTSLAGPLAAAFAEALSGMVVRPVAVRPDSLDGADSLDGLAPLDGTGSPDGTVSRGTGSPTIAVVSTDLLATWQHPFDWWPTMEAGLLQPLSDGRDAELPVVQWVSGDPQPGGTVSIPPVDVLILEGVSSGRRSVHSRLSALIWVEVPGRERRLERAVARDGEQARWFLKQWQIDEERHFRLDGTRERADLVITPA